MGQHFSVIPNVVLAAICHRHNELLVSLNIFIPSYFLRVVRYCIWLIRTAIMQIYPHIIIKILRAQHVTSPACQRKHICAGVWGFPAGQVWVIEIIFSVCYYIYYSPINIPPHQVKSGFALQFLQFPVYVQRLQRAICVLCRCIVSPLIKVHLPAAHAVFHVLPRGGGRGLVGLFYPQRRNGVVGLCQRLCGFCLSGFVQLVCPRICKLPRQILCAVFVFNSHAIYIIS